MKTQIKAEIVADSINSQGDRLTSLLITFPRIILAEVNTHRMLSKNTSSSRAIPFKKMVEAVENDPFVPIAWQKDHSGMQGSEYWKEDEWVVDSPGVTKYNPVNCAKGDWLKARDEAVKQAERLSKKDITKQLCNRLLEPFMWTTMLITGSKEGWDNFFELRCPQYTMGTSDGFYKSRKDLLKAYPANKSVLDIDLYWLSINKGQAEIHIMDLAEKIYDALNGSTPKQLQSGEWHIPFGDRIVEDDLLPILYKVNAAPGEMAFQKVKIATAMAARTSYTVVGEEKEIDYAKMIELHDRLIAQDPPHSSPLEHCAKAMTHDEYYSFQKGFINMDELEVIVEDSPTNGWCRNFKGFIQYRHLIEINESI